MSGLAITTSSMSASPQIALAQEPFQHGPGAIRVRGVGHAQTLEAGASLEAAVVDQVAPHDDGLVAEAGGRLPLSATMRIGMPSARRR